MGTTATLREESVMTEGYARPAQRIVSSDAVQGIAVDVQHVYTIANRSIGKYDKFSGEPVSRWQAQERDGRIVHLDSGVIHEGKLYAAHSNWPGVPMVSSVEIFDIARLSTWRTIRLEPYVDRSPGWIALMGSGGERSRTMAPGYRSAG